VKVCGGVYFKACGAALAALAACWFMAAPNEAVAAKTCSQTANPVCAVAPDGSSTVYTNKCLARAADARVLHAGKCQGPICMELYLPVCATNPDTHQPQTYSNQCFADVAKATVTSKGACS
jgi:hypothetical protein